MGKQSGLRRQHSAAKNNETGIFPQFYHCDAQGKIEIRPGLYITRKTQLQNVPPNLNFRWTDDGLWIEEKHELSRTASRRRQHDTG
jgi:hypothetical protein